MCVSLVNEANQQQTNSIAAPAVNGGPDEERAMNGPAIRSATSKLARRVSVAGDSRMFQLTHPNNEQLARHLQYSSRCAPVCHFGKSSGCGSGRTRSASTCSADFVAQGVSTRKYGSRGQIKIALGNAIARVEPNVAKQGAAIVCGISRRTDWEAFRRLGSVWEMIGKRDRQPQQPPRIREILARIGTIQPFWMSSLTGPPAGHCRTPGFCPS
jgi:hypothetical protein